MNDDSLPYSYSGGIEETQEEDGPYSLGHRTWGADIYLLRNFAPLLTDFVRVGLGTDVTNGSKSSSTTKLLPLHIQNAQSIQIGGIN